MYECVCTRPKGRGVKGGKGGVCMVSLSRGPEKKNLRTKSARGRKDLMT